MRIRSRWLTLAISKMIVILTKMLFWTCRKTYCFSASDTDPYVPIEKTRYLYCIWHDRILMTLFIGKPQNVAGLVSKHQDGSYVADTMNFLNIKPVRGSTQRGGTEALRQLMGVAKDYHIAITPDGPRGPRREIKQGIVFLASKTGNSIIPLAYHCKSYWSLKGNWTDLMIPKPFTKVAVFGGHPIPVPKKCSREQMDEIIQQLEAMMEHCEKQALRLVKGETPEQVLADNQPQETRAAA